MVMEVVVVVVVMVVMVLWGCILTLSHSSHNGILQPVDECARVCEWREGRYERERESITNLHAL